MPSGEMMNEMIERVDRAIQSAMSIRAYGLCDYSSFPSGSPLHIHVVRNELTGNAVFRSNSSKSASDEYEKLCKAYIAKAVIKAMREPTDQMLEDGYESMFDDKYDGSQAPMMNATWQAMIDAALKDD